ncbi:PH domain-containing protein [Jatrophihabitans cynanchi]|uniref:PH domain-containing protein n=1 Tax=Jatrophihabitans cynanchi TaxID=2944128 RepID=A0ABY7JW09_9ACTN|nr:PH domain-containing protein [Jatrophihabitans sp. SB3-54]WAX55276.1 PH domain-containing protein [Jatrophihabitans sp. SB3-54]
MDNERMGPPRRVRLHFGPDHRLTALTGLLCVLAVGAAALTGDPAGRLLFAGAAAVLLGYALIDLLCWPRLAADAHGLELRTPFTHLRLPWEQVDDVRADVRDRLGLRSRTLEIDAGPHLVVFSRRALGADPEQVAALVRACRPD